MTETEFSCRIASVGRRGVTILLNDGCEVPARVAGRVYHDLQPVAGDRARAMETSDLPMITAILPRDSVLQRSTGEGSARIIAANIQYVLVVCSLKRPAFSHGFLSRVLVASCWKGLPAVIVINKTDLCSGPGDYGDLIRTYGKEGAGYRIFPVSCFSGEGMEDLLDFISGSTVVMTGPSGVGKTSIARVWNPSLGARVGELNPKTGKGRHTTVSASLIPMDGSTCLIDTPGIKIFTIDHVPRKEIAPCFPEFEPYLGNCRFRDCLHLSEPGCAVKSAVKRGDISEFRYEGYCELMDASSS